MRAAGGDPAADEIIRLLGLKPHPEGGHYGETFRSEGLSVIHYLLQAGEVSAWHRVDMDEAWAWHAGGPLALRMALPEAAGSRAVHLGPDLRAGQRPHAVVPAGHWQAAETLGAWTLVSCMVGPAFQFEAFELAPPGWSPAR